MKTQNTKLQFEKSSITELNDTQAIGVNGGGDTRPCFFCIRTSNGPGGTVLEDLLRA